MTFDHFGEPNYLAPTAHKPKIGQLGTTPAVWGAEQTDGKKVVEFSETASVTTLPPSLPPPPPPFSDAAIGHLLRCLRIPPSGQTAPTPLLTHIILYVPQKSRVGFASRRHQKNHPDRGSQKVNHCLQGTLVGCDFCTLIVYTKDYYPSAGAKKTCQRRKGNTIFDKMKYIVP